MNAIGYLIFGIIVALLAAFAIFGDTIFGVLAFIMLGIFGIFTSFYDDTP